MAPRWLRLLVFVLVTIVLFQSVCAEDSYEEDGEEEEILYGDEEEGDEVALELPGAKHSRPHGQLSLKVGAKQHYT